MSSTQDVEDMSLLSKLPKDIFEKTMSYIEKKTYQRLIINDQFAIMKMNSGYELEPLYGNTPKKFCIQKIEDVIDFIYNDILADYDYEDEEDEEESDRFVIVFNFTNTGLRNHFCHFYTDQETKKIQFRKLYKIIKLYVGMVGKVYTID